MAGQKFLSIRGPKGQVLHPGFRYKHLRAAVRKATDLVMTEGKDVEILDLSRGFVLMRVVRHGQYDIKQQHLYPLTVKRLWRL